MNYFEILDLGAEPFSNSPDPDFLYRSRGHEQCLHALEISLRLRRGLSVVLGEVGTGKTTLCRELLRALDDDESVTAHLVLDPGFSTPVELLTVLHGLFCEEGTAAALSDWQLKEDIKNAIFEHGVDEDRILALIIDEGQKLPADCLEVLRELLNYETNDRKLLQIVVFAQTEFRQTLAAMPNLADRVNDLIRLGPLSLAETKAMVRHRLDRAKAEYRAPELFTHLGYAALHRITGGYPRRIVRLAHKVVLALIIQKQRKAGRRLVRACARDNEMAPPRTRWILVPTLALCLLILLAWPALQSLEQQEKPRRPDMNSAASANAPASVPARVAAPMTTTPAQPAVPIQRAVPSPASETSGKKATARTYFSAAPKVLGTVAVRKDENLSMLTRAVYGSFTTDLLGTVLAANQSLNDNPDLLEIGDTIRFPGQGMMAREAWWIPLGDAATLAEAMELWRAAPPECNARILAHRDATDTLRFALIAGSPGETEDAARREIDTARIDAARLDTAPVRGMALFHPHAQPMDARRNPPAPTGTKG